MPFAQFGVDPAKFFEIYNEYTIPESQLKDWRDDRTGCVIGRKLAEERKIKVGDPFPLKDGVYPLDLNMTVRGIFDGPVIGDLRACYFDWNFLEEGLKKAGEPGIGQRWRDHFQGQGREPDGLHQPQDRRGHQQQRLAHQVAIRRGFWSDVRGDDRRFQVDHHLHRARGGNLLALRHRQRDGHGPP